ncbi:MAG: hypothetical protein WCP77_14640 [Roseococcus sp.]
MNEGPWTVAAQLCSSETQLQAACKELAKALQRIGAVARMSETECGRADVQRASREATLIAWRNVNDVMEDVTMAAEGALAALMEVTLRASTASQMKENDE